MVSEPKNRVLRLLMSGCSAEEEGGVVTFGVGSDEWTTYTSALGFSYGVNRQYFDLQGYANEDLSFFPVQPQVQDQGQFTMVDPSGAALVDLITVKPIDDDDLETLINPSLSINAYLPGTLHSRHGLQDIIYARFRQFMPSLDIQGTVVVSQDTAWGLSTATARDRIFVTRIIMGLSTASIFYVPPSAWVIAGVSAEEKDLVYVERLRRGYDHSAPG